MACLFKNPSMTMWIRTGESGAGLFGASSCFSGTATAGFGVAGAEDMALQVREGRHFCYPVLHATGREAHSGRPSQGLQPQARRPPLDGHVPQTSSIQGCDSHAQPLRLGHACAAPEQWEPSLPPPPLPEYGTRELTRRAS